MATNAEQPQTTMCVIRVYDPIEDEEHLIGACFSKEDAETYCTVMNQTSPSMDVYSYTPVQLLDGSAPGPVC